MNKHDCVFCVHDAVCDLEDRKDHAYNLRDGTKDCFVEKPAASVQMFYTKTYLCPPDCGGEEFDEWGYLPLCPRCGVKLDETRKQNFCAECGQRLNWQEQQYINPVWHGY